MISHWKFDETSGVSAADSAGTNNGTLSAYVQRIQDGKLGKAIRFSGLSYVETKNQLVQQAASGIFSTSMWVRLPTNGQLNMQLFGGKVGQSAFIATMQVTKDYVLLKWYGYDSGGDGPASSFQYFYPTAQSGTTIPTSTWVHIATVWNYQNSVLTRKVYLNGIAMSEGIITGYPSPGRLESSAGYIILGTTSETYSGTTTPLYQSNADLDDVRIYSKALSSTEVGQLYNPSASPTPTQTSTTNATNTTTNTTPTVTPTPTPTPVLCTDSDGGINEYVIGTTRGLPGDSSVAGSSSATDYCSITPTGIGLSEYYCGSGGKLSRKTFDCYCRNGECKSLIPYDDFSASILNTSKWIESTDAAGFPTEHKINSRYGYRILQNTTRDSVVFLEMTRKIEAGEKVEYDVDYINPGNFSAKINNTGGGNIFINDGSGNNVSGNHIHYAKINGKSVPDLFGCSNCGALGFWNTPGTVDSPTDSFTKVRYHFSFAFGLNKQVYMEASKSGRPLISRNIVLTDSGPYTFTLVAGTGHNGIMNFDYHDVVISYNATNLTASPTPTPTPVQTSNCTTSLQPLYNGDLLVSSIRLEALKANFDATQIQADQLIQYWQAAGNQANLNFWTKIKTALNALSTEIQAINQEILSIGDNPTQDQLDKIKLEVNQLKANIQGILESI